MSQHTPKTVKEHSFVVFSYSTWFTVIIVIYACKKPKFMDSMTKPKVFYQAEISHADGSVNSQCIHADANTTDTPERQKDIVQRDHHKKITHA